MCKFEGSKRESFKKILIILPTGLESQQEHREDTSNGGIALKAAESSDTTSFDR